MNQLLNFIYQTHYGTVLAVVLVMDAVLKLVCRGSIGTEDFEVRICKSEGVDGENIATEKLELYVI